MSFELEREVHHLRLGQHACFLYDNAADDRATLAPYFKDGLDRSEQCFLVAAQSAWPALLALLKETGVDVGREVDRRSLRFLPVERYFSRGFDPAAQLRVFEVGTDAAMTAGFSGIRVCAQLSDVHGGPLDPNLLEFEAMSNDLVARRQVVTLCRYDLRRETPSFIRQVLRVHPLAVIGPLVCPNAFYEPPNLAMGHGSPDEGVRWMLDQLCRSRLEKLALEKAVRARDEFLSAASHELRTPLAATQLNLQAVARRAEALGGELDAVVPNLRRAVEQLKRFALVVQHLVDASMAREDRLQFHIEDVDLGALAQQVAAQFDSAARNSGCSLHVDVPPSPVIGRWDRMRLEQVLVNLISNSLKFGAQHPIELRVSRANGRARLTVRDYGSGIPESDRERIFQRFEQAAPVSHYGGFGLGLWIVRKIVDAFGGTIVASNAQGGGAHFSIELPINIAPEQHAPTLA
jgi:signal transduction histidine kinase